MARVCSRQVILLLDHLTRLGRPPRAAEWYARSSHAFADTRVGRARLSALLAKRTQGGRARRHGGGDRRRVVENIARLEDDLEEPVARGRRGADPLVR